jgi:hypothetical protein
MKEFLNKNIDNNQSFPQIIPTISRITPKDRNT